MPGSKRRVPRGKTRSDRDAKKEVMDEIYLLTDEEITEAIDTGIKSVLETVTNDPADGGLRDVEGRAPLPTFAQLRNEKLLKTTGSSGPRTVGEWELSIQDFLDLGANESQGLLDAQTIVLEAELKKRARA